MMTKKKKVAFAVATVFTALALVALGFSIALSVPFYAEVPEGGDFGESLGAGLSKAFAAIFSLLFGIGCVICAVVGFLVSFLNRKVEEQPFRGLFVGYSISNAVAAFAAVATYAAMMIFGG